jgi:hypothetical protein
MKKIKVTFFYAGVLTALFAAMGCVQVAPSTSPASSSPGPVSISFNIYSETSRDDGIVYGTDAAFGDWGTTITNEISSGGAAEGTKYFKLTISNQSWGWFANGIERPSGTSDMSAYVSGHLNFKIRTTISAPLKAGIKGGGNEKYANISNYGYTNTGTWQTVSMPIAILTTGSPSPDLSKITLFFMIANDGGSWSDGNTIDLDDIYWTKN